MLNFTLTITAAPELLAAMSNFTKAITSAKVVTVPQSNTDFKSVRSANEQIATSVTHQPIPQAITYPAPNSAVQQINPAQQPVQNQAPVSVVPMYYQQATTPANSVQNQPISAQVNPIHNQPISVPTNPVQALPQGAIQPPPVQGSAVPTSSQSYTMEQLSLAATQLVDGGRRAELVNLLGSFGVPALTVLPKEQYGAFATQLRELGVKL